MKTPKVGNIAAKISHNKKSKFNLSHDVNTSYDWGSVQPIMSQLMLPDSSINVNIEQLTRLAPMVCPTFGRVKLKNIAHFIPMKEIFPNWDYFLAKKPISRGASGAVNTFTPDKLPYINNSILTALSLAGAKFNIYFSAKSGDTDFVTNTDNWICAANRASWSSPTWSTATTATREALNKLLVVTSSANPSTSTINSLNYTGYGFVVRNLTTGTLSNGTALATNMWTADGDAFAIVPCNTTMKALRTTASNITHSANNETMGNSYNPAYDPTNPITIDGADLIWESDEITAAMRASGSGKIWEGMSTDFFDGRKIRIVFKLSSFGKRMRKILIGLGYNFSLNDDSNVSILPLFAFFKAYWDTYAPQRTKNFYMTECWKLIEIVSNDPNFIDLTSILNNSTYTNVRSIFKKFFFLELGCAFATEKMDAFSAATDSPILSDINNGNAAAMQTVNDALQDWYTHFTPYNQDGKISYHIDASSPNRVPTIENSPNSLGNMSITQPVLDGLKKAYIYVNKMSVAGQNIATILRMNGQGAYVDECNGKFINASDDAIKISDVIATADTTSNVGIKGAALGQYGGRGLGMGNHQFSFSTDKHGYMIILSTMVPEAGYVNGVNKTNEFIDFGDWYNPELDGLSYEAIQKKQMYASPVIQKQSANDIQSTFGFLPTYSNYKFCTNIANGDFSLNSRKTSTLPYTLDKYLPIYTPSVEYTGLVTAHTGSTETVETPALTYFQVPNAGEDYRYINKMAWNGNYDRIFLETGDGINWTDRTFGGNNTDYLFNSFEYDNFLTHNVMDVAYWAPMKAIEDSYSTYDNEHPDTNGAISKS